MPAAVAHVIYLDVQRLSLRLRRFSRTSYELREFFDLDRCLLERGICNDTTTHSSPLEPPVQGFVEDVGRE